MRYVMNARHRPGIFLLLLLVALLGGCAAPQTRQLLNTPPPLPQSAELITVPFFPQQEYQCGPAALATVLNQAGVNVTPDELVPQVYLPERKGSLQFELLAATRRYGRIPYPLKPQLSALLTEVAGGNPVLVLQNLGLDTVPVWHYAVVMGYDLRDEEIVLRSGIEARHITPLSTFERTWARSNYWGVVVTPPDKLPKTAEEQPYLEAVVTLEKQHRWQEAATAYNTVLKRWPQSLGAAMGLGNSRYALGDLPAAEAAFRSATQRHPDSGAAFNNLAQALADQKRWDEAEAAAQQAVAIGGRNIELFRQTLSEIQAKNRAQ